MPRLDDQPKEASEQLTELFATERETFVICFSEDGGDRLSQWRAYGGNSGVCLKFKKTALDSYCQTSDEDRSVELKKIHYVSPKGDSHVNALAEKILNSSDITGFNVKSPTRISIQVSVEGTFLKHEAFREEKEWRMLVLKLDQDLKHRVRGSLLVPYIELDLNGALADLLDAVIVGPINHKDQTAKAIKGLLQDQGLRSVDVTCSETPYRGF